MIINHFRTLKLFFVKTLVHSFLLVYLNVLESDNNWIRNSFQSEVTWSNDFWSGSDFILKDLQLDFNWISKWSAHPSPSISFEELHLLFNQVDQRSMAWLISIQVEEWILSVRKMIQKMYKTIQIIFYFLFLLLNYKFIC